MGFLKNGEELRQEGKGYYDAKDYARALRCFEKAFEKGDHDSLFLIYETHKSANQIDRGIELLETYVDEPAFSVSERIQICTVLAQNEKIRGKYLRRAADLGHALSQNTLFKNACAACDMDAILTCGEQILENATASEEMKISVLQQYLNRVEHEVSLGENYYTLHNGTIGKHTYLSLLHEVISRPASSEKLRNGAKLALARYYLIDRYYRTTTENQEQYFEVYSTAFSTDVDVVQLLKEIYLDVDLARYYLALVYTFGLGGVEKVDFDVAINYLTPLAEIKNYQADKYSPGSRQLVSLLNNQAVYGLDMYLWYNSRRNFTDTIIGNQSFKDAINTHLSILDRQYDKWNGTSNFVFHATKRRVLDSNIWIFDGEPSNAKKTLASDYCCKLAYHCYKNPVFKVIDPFEINASAGIEAKYAYLRSKVEDVKDEECCVLYFDSPYLVSKDSSGFDGLNQALQYLIRLIDNHAEGIIVLVLGGDGEQIKNHLVSTGIPDYKYNSIPFYGYSADEVIDLLDMLNKKASANGASIELNNQTLSEVHHLVNLRNNANNRNVNFDDVNFIYASLRNHYYTHSGESATDYTPVLENIEKELGVHQQEESDFNKTMEELDSMIGLTNIKAKMRSIIGSVRVNKMRIHNGLKPINNSLHMVFAGNPGTGKTTVAKMMGKILKELEVLSRGHVVEVSRSDLVDIYFGGTANKTRNVLNRALNGVLFIDEAYTLTNNSNSGGMKDYGVEAVEEILKFMSDHNNEICVIVAGYTKEMQDFIATNPGLQSRFNTWVEFEDYSEEELYSIFEGLCKKNDFTIQEEVRPLILADFKKAKAGGTNFGNARFVGTYFNELVEKLGNYLTMKYSFSDAGMPTKSELQSFTIELFDGRSDYSADFAFADFFAQ